MNEDGVPVVVQDLPTSIHGFCCIGEDYEPCIVINSRLDNEHQREAYLHEMNHIASGEIYDEGYVEYE